MKETSLEGGKLLIEVVKPEEKSKQFGLPHIAINKLAKARRTRTSLGTLGLKKFGLGKLWVKKVFRKKIHFQKIHFKKIHFQ